MYAVITVITYTLFGDLQTTLAGFRAGKFNVLVATDVAARGLDISGVELVLQLEPPKDPENYIHRSGRTGAVYPHSKSPYVFLEYPLLPRPPSMSPNPIEPKPAFLYLLTPLRPSPSFSSWHSIVPYR